MRGNPKSFWTHENYKVVDDVTDVRMVVVTFVIISGAFSHSKSNLGGRGQSTTTIAQFM